MAGVTIEVPDDDVVVREPRQTGTGNTDAGFADLKAQLDEVTKKADDASRRADDERRRAANAEETARRERADADQAREEARTARTDSVEGRRLAIDNALAASKSTLESLESEIASLNEAGNFKAAAALYRKMAETAADMKSLEAGKSALASEDIGTRRETTEGRVTKRDDPSPRREAETAEDKFEAAISQYSPSVKDWIRKHPEVVSNQQKNNQAMAAHHEALAQGYAAETDAYFSYIDRKMGYRSDRAATDVARDNPINDDNRGNDRQQQQQRGQIMRSAPVSRNGSGGRSSQVELTENELDNSTNGAIVWNAGERTSRGEVIKADDPRVGQPIGEYEFAWRKSRMQKEGRYAVPALQ